MFVKFDNSELADFGGTSGDVRGVPIQPVRKEWLDGGGRKFSRFQVPLQIHTAVNKHSQSRVSLQLAYSNSYWDIVV